MWIYINKPDQAIWLAKNYKWAWYLNIFSMTIVKTRLKNLSHLDFCHSDAGIRIQIYSLILWAVLSPSLNPCHAEKSKIPRQLLSTNQVTRSRVLIQVHTLNVKQCRSRSVGFYADLDRQCLQRQGISELSYIRVKGYVICLFLIVSHLIFYRSNSSHTLHCSQHLQLLSLFVLLSAQLAFYVNLHRAVIGPSATLTGRWRPDIDLRRMLTGCLSWRLWSSLDLSCSICNRQFRAKIGLISHLRTYK